MLEEVYRMAPLPKEYMSDMREMWEVLHSFSLSTSHYPHDTLLLLQDAQNMLEEVYRVAPVPEEYMKYQLHVSTGMEMPQIELWFQNRRSSEGSSQLPMEGQSPSGSPSPAEG